MFINVLVNQLKKMLHVTIKYGLNLKNTPSKLKI